VVQLLTLTPALATKFAVDTVMGHHRSSLLPALAVGVAALVLTQGVAAYARASLLNHLRARLDEAVMTRFFRHLLALPFRYFQVRNSGDLLLRLSSNATLREMMTGQTLSLVVDGLFVLVYLVLLAVLAPVYAVVVLVLGVLLAAVVAGTFHAMRELTEQEVTSQADAQNLAVEILNSVESVKAAGAEREVYDRWARRPPRRRTWSSRRGRGRSRGRTPCATWRARPRAPAPASSPETPRRSCWRARGRPRRGSGASPGRRRVWRARSRF